MVIEDLSIVVPGVSLAPFKYVPVVCQEITNLTMSEPIAEKEEIAEWDITAISQSSSGQEQKQRPNELAYQVNEMQVQNWKRDSS